MRCDFTVLGAQNHTTIWCHYSRIAQKHAYCIFPSLECSLESLDVNGALGLQAKPSAATCRINHPGAFSLSRRVFLNPWVSTVCKSTACRRVGLGAERPYICVPISRHSCADGACPAQLPMANRKLLITSYDREPFEHVIAMTANFSGHMNISPTSQHLKSPTRL